MSKTYIGIGSVIAALLYIMVNLFLPDQISILSFVLQDPTTILENLIPMLIVAFVCEIIGVALGAVITMIVDI